MSTLRIPSFLKYYCKVVLVLHGAVLLHYWASFYLRGAIKLYFAQRILFFMEYYTNFCENNVTFSAIYLTVIFWGSFYSCDGSKWLANFSILLDHFKEDYT